MTQDAIAFSDLIAPLAPADVSALWRSQTFKHQRGSGEHRFGALLNWDSLWALIDGAVIAPESCRVTYARRTVDSTFYLDEGRFNPDRLAGLFEQGVSMIIVKLNEHVPSIAAACRDAANFGLRIVHAGAIATTGDQGAFGSHYDLFHLIVLQVEGSKRWRVYGPRAHKPTAAMATVDPPQSPPILDTVLQEGDILFLPSGYWHSCDNGPGRSLHVTLGCVAKPTRTPGEGANPQSRGRYGVEDRHAGSD
ncbi:MAG TPA: cupin domain-containing protein [Caulobacteraceae bacterium]|nr:cupin domain-containing protein [Caulobacteraceae bacterium]